MSILQRSDTMTFYNKLLLIVVYTASVSCHSAFVDTSPKCGEWDYECHRNVIQSVLQNIGKTEFPELDIIPIDPLDIAGFHVPVYDLIDATVTKGNVKGIKSCTLSKFIINFEHGLISAEAVCDIVVEGNYKVSSHNPLIKIFLGTDALHGEGSGHIKIDQFKVSVDYPFDLVRRNHELYINSQSEKSNFTFDVLGKVQFYADKGFGNDQSSEVLVRVLNENWKLVMNIVWGLARDIATGFSYDFSTKFFKNVPLKNFITEDLSSYIHG